MEQLIKDIEHMRDVLGLSKRDLAIKAEITEEYYWRITTGKAPGVAYSVLNRLAESVNIRLMHYIDPASMVKPETRGKKPKKHFKSE